MFMLCRGAEDESITSPEGKRDYVCLVDSMLIIAGEDKTSKPQMAEADDDLLKKHVRSNRAMYGRLEYIILITTAGPLLEFTAMSIIPGRGLQELCPALEVLPMHKHQLFTKMARPTPYPELIGYHLPNQVTLKLNHVEKSIVVPFLYLDDLVKTYRMLGSGAVPGACHVDKLEIDGDIMDLRARGWKLPVAPGDVGLITLTLRPVGMHLHIGSNAQLQSLIKQLLVTLTALHKQNWVHRDVRMDNLVHGPTGWVLID